MVMGMTRVDEVAYITVGVGELRITNTSDGNGNDKRMVRCERLSPPNLETKCGFNNIVITN